MAWNVRFRASFGALALILTTAVPAIADPAAGESTNAGNLPPPPIVVVKEEPKLVIVPGTTVYVVSDDRYTYDCFKYGVYWYAWSDGFWYRSRAWRGPFVAVETRVVPRAIINVPAKHWRHHPHGGPAGLAKQRKVRDVVVVSKPRPAVVITRGAPARNAKDGRGR